MLYHVPVIAKVKFYVAVEADDKNEAMHEVREFPPEEIPDDSSIQDIVVCAKEFKEAIEEDSEFVEFDLLMDEEFDEFD
jgi:hypothetical protein